MHCCGSFTSGSRSGRRLPQTPHTSSEPPKTLNSVLATLIFNSIIFFFVSSVVTGPFIFRGICLGCLETACLGGEAERASEGGTEPTRKESDGSAVEGEKGGISVKAERRTKRAMSQQGHLQHTHTHMQWAWLLFLCSLSVCSLHPRMNPLTSPH